MSIMRTLEHPETIETRQGLKKVTHEVYGYAITPFQNPPIKVHTYKGMLDAMGHFQLLVETQSTIEITLDEFRWLLNPTPSGKPAGDFRLSDVLGVLKRRFEKMEDKPPTEKNRPSEGIPQTHALKGEEVVDPKDPATKSK